MLRVCNDLCREKNEGIFRILEVVKYESRIRFLVFALVFPYDILVFCLLEFAYKWTNLSKNGQIFVFEVE